MIKKILGDVRGGEQGFTMVENLLSTIIVGVGLMGGMVTMQNSTLHTVKSDMTTIATQLANQKIETILADKEFLGYDYLAEADNYPIESISEYTGFKRIVKIDDVNSDDLATEEADSGLRRVSVTVDWGGNEPESAVTVSTLVTNYE